MGEQEATRLERIAWRGGALFVVDLVRADIDRRFGPAHELGCITEGIGTFDAWDLGFRCGLEVGIGLYLPGVGGFPDLMPHFSAEVCAHHRDADHILFHLGCAGAEIGRYTPDRCPPVPARYRLVRADDNGNVVEMARFTSACEATAAAAAYEARGHKQLYSVEPI